MARDLTTAILDREGFTLVRFPEVDSAWQAGDRIELEIQCVAEDEIGTATSYTCFRAWLKIAHVDNECCQGSIIVIDQHAVPDYLKATFAQGRRVKVPLAAIRRVKRV